MPVGEVAPGLGEGAEIGNGLHGGDAREFLAQICGFISRTSCPISREQARGLELPKPARTEANQVL